MVDPWWPVVLSMLLQLKDMEEEDMEEQDDAEGMEGIYMRL